MTVGDLVFLASVLFVVTLCLRVAISVMRRRWKTAGRLGRLLAWFAAIYTLVLISVGLLMPRRVYVPGARRCFDDWCASAIEARPSNVPGGCNWMVTIEISSDAKRVRQRARDARAEVEDQRGTRYQPCGPPLARGAEPARALSDELGPGESFDVVLAFRLPAGRTPAGLVLHHGDFPGVVIIGADQSLLHPPGLQPFPREAR
ncbi:MAG TPA: hypothetical protein VML19_20720 [Verrucomicrobiae bacterium]|nr:hypothetical protein [Verrucomicrobiae bacterium]